MKFRVCLSCFVLGLIFFLVSCSSTKKLASPEDVPHTDLRPDFKVIEAASKVRPGWIEDPQLWAKDYAQGVDKFRFFSYETEPKESREVACQLARANARVDIASEISAEINKTLVERLSGDPRMNMDSSQMKNLQNYLDLNLEESVQAQIHGAQVEKVYWEKRKYLQDLGAKEDYTGYTCAAFIKIDQKVLNSAINVARDILAKRAELKAVPQAASVLDASVEIAKKELLDPLANFNEGNANMDNASNEEGVSDE